MCIFSSFAVWVGGGGGSETSSLPATVIKPIPGWTRFVLAELLSFRLILFTLKVTKSPLSLYPFLVHNLTHTYSIHMLELLALLLVHTVDSIFLMMLFRFIKDLLAVGFGGGAMN